MFSYYGSKSKIVQYYPSPTCDKIIEPFAGSARYSLRYWDKEVLLVDKYKVIVDIWHYLQRASEKDILGLPKLTKGMDIRTLNLSDEERLFLSFFCASGQGKSNYIVTKFGDHYSGNQNRYNKIASDLHKIKHWKIIQGNYEDLGNENATWFIDPPYQFGGDHQYKFSNKQIDFNSLANYCKSRNGQVIVCENTKANWLEFKPVIQIQGANNTNTTEAIWTNFRTQYDSIQQDLFGRGNKKECVNVA